eukprot:6469777-Amphidinium_carterae.4
MRADLTNLARSSAESVSPTTACMLSTTVGADLRVNLTSATMHQHPFLWKHQWEGQGEEGPPPSDSPSLEGHFFLLPCPGPLSHCLSDFCFLLRTTELGLLAFSQHCPFQPGLHRLCSVAKIRRPVCSASSPQL